MWVHEQRNGPNFTWDMDAIASRLGGIRYRESRILGRMESLGFELKREASLNVLTDDVVKSSAIEGEKLNPDEVRSSIARRLGMDTAGLAPASRHVDGIVEMMLGATQQFNKPLTQERLFDWHAALFPTGRSGMHTITVDVWRTVDAGAMQVVSGPIGREKIHFEAPHVNRLTQEMSTFLNWFENEMSVDSVLKASVAHFWFVTIHPFEDGNGRIGRAIADMALARADGSADRFYSLSSQIESKRKNYYQQLESQQRSTTDITEWLMWFLDCVDNAICNAEIALDSVLFKAQLWEKINIQPVNERQRRMINRMLRTDFQGYMNTSKYAALAKCSKDTALCDIQELKSRGIFIQNPGGGRSTSYRLPDES